MPAEEHEPIEESNRNAFSVALERRTREHDQPDTDAVAHTDHTAFSSNPW